MLHLVMDYRSNNYWQVKETKMVKGQQLKILAFQLLRGLCHLHALQIMHRDLSVEHVLVDERLQLAICDLGNAKHLVLNQPSACYLGHRYYRAPELIFGSEHYTESIDLWAAGCVLAELILGRPLFKGSSTEDQLVTFSI